MAAVRTPRAVAVLAFTMALPLGARAGEPPKPAGREAFSPYERESLEAALKERNTSIDPAPEGKILEAIDVETLEVLEERDPLQGWGFDRPDGTRLSMNEVLNDLHTTTRGYVIEREVLLSVGQPYKQVLADETERNLRRLIQLSLIIVVPTRGSAPDRVRLLIITKDVWSIRLNSDIRVGSGGLESLLLEPTESNLAGTHQIVFTHFQLLPNSYTLGAGYTERRLAGTRIVLGANANLIINRETGQPEGTSGSVTTGLPLYSATREWAWGVTTSWSDSVLRRYVNARLSYYDAKATPFNDHIPFEYRGVALTETASLTRSYGWAHKNDFTVGAEINKRTYRTDDLSQYDPAAAAEFVARNVPVSDTRVGPYVQWQSYETDFVELLDIETLGLQEDYRLGHSVIARVYPVTRALGSSRDFLGVYAGAQYTIQLGTAIARAAVETTTEAEADRLSDASVGAGVRLVSPRFPFGRIVLDAAGLNRYRNYLNHLTFLGGNSRLRGYPSNFYVGKDWAAANVEYRTRALEILGSQLGAALFYDVGDAFDGVDNFRAKQSVGVGFRVLFPQLDKFVLRGDIGFPLPPRDAGVSGLGFFLAFEQAFPFPAVSGGAGGALGQ
jgi:hypothetical protein